MNDPKEPRSQNSDPADEPAANGPDEAPIKSCGLVRLPSGTIVVTQLFCPNGHDLVDRDSSTRFEGHFGIVLSVRGKHAQGDVVLSPVHGDHTKFGESDFEPGEVLDITCPTCGSEFPEIQPCGCTAGSSLIGLFLDPDLEPGNQVVVCNAWGCLRSRIIDRFQVISKFE